MKSPDLGRVNAEGRSSGRSRDVDPASILVLFLGMVVLMAWLGARGLNEPDEGRYAEIGREMALQTNWLIPHLNGVEHFQKPPLTYWLIAISIRLFGANEWAVRLVPAIAAWGTLVSVMFIAGRLFGPSSRWKSGLILLSSLEFFAMGRIITTDMLLTFWITTAIAGLVAYHTHGGSMRLEGAMQDKRGRTALLPPEEISRTGLVVFYLAMGLGFLTKGPMALLVPGCAALGLRYGVRRANGPLPRMAWLTGLCLTLMVGLFWFVLVIWKYPVLWRYFLGYELVDRIVSNVHDRSKPFWFYPAILFCGFLPWSFFLPILAGDVWKSRRALDRSKLGLLSGWVLLPLLVLTLTKSKLATYMLPLFPAMSVAMAYGWDRMVGQRGWTIAVRSLSWAFVLLIVLMPCAVVMARQLYPDPIHFPTTVSLCAGLCILFFLAARRVSEIDRLRRWTMQCIGGGTIALCLLLFSQMDRILLGGNSPMKNAAEQIKREEGDTPARVFMCGIRSNGIEFYLQRFVDRTENASDQVLTLDPDTLARIVKEEETHRHIKGLSKMHAYVIVKERRYVKEPIFRNWQVLSRFGTCVLLASPPKAQSNQPLTARYHPDFRGVSRSELTHVRGHPR